MIKSEEANKIPRVEKKKTKPDELTQAAESWSKDQNIKDLHTDLNELQKGNEQRTDLVKKKNGDLSAHSYCILNTRKNTFY